MTTAQDGGKVVSLTHRPPLPPGKTPGTQFCWRLSRPQGHTAAGRIKSSTAASRFKGTSLQLVTPLGGLDLKIKTELASQTGTTKNLTNFPR